MMHMDYLTGGFAGLAILGQLINLVLNLQLRNAILESERRILEKADERYVHKDVFEMVREGHRGTD
jgi:hypothetical protein